MSQTISALKKNWRASLLHFSLFFASSFFLLPFFFQLYVLLGWSFKRFFLFSLFFFSSTFSRFSPRSSMLIFCPPPVFLPTFIPFPVHFSPSFCLFSFYFAFMCVYIYIYIFDVIIFAQREAPSTINLRTLAQLKTFFVRLVICIICLHIYVFEVSAYKRWHSRVLMTHSHPNWTTIRTANIWHFDIKKTREDTYDFV